MVRPFSLELPNFEPEKKKEIAEIEITSEDGLIIYREIYDDKSHGPWERTGREVTDTARTLAELAKRYGVEKLPGKPKSLPEKYF